MELVAARPEDEDLVLALFARSPSYFMSVEGCLPGPHTAHEAVTGRPARTLESYRKEFLFIKVGGEIVGSVELHADHPDLYTAYIGLLLIRDDLHGRHIGREAYALVEDYIRRRFSCRHIRLGVSDQNDVSGFWSKMGFAANGRNYSWVGERKVSNVVEYEKHLSPG